MIENVRGIKAKSLSPSKLREQTSVDEINQHKADTSDQVKQRVEVEAPAVEVEAPAVKVEAPAVKVEAPAVKVEAPREPIFVKKS